MVKQPWMYDHPLLVGFEQLFDSIKENQANGFSNYPPFNVKRKDSTFVIEVAVAGFTLDELDITFDDEVLKIEAEQKDKEDDGFLFVHKGISSRNFSKTFTLMTGVEVRSAKLSEGILTIVLELVAKEKTTNRINIE